MKLIIAGSRTFNPNLGLICELLVHFKIDYEISEIISGKAAGVDLIGKLFASLHKYASKTFKPNWAEHGKAAGPIRNKKMAEYADTLLLIWDGESKGSANMKEEMLKLNKPIYEVILRRHNVSS